MKPIRALSTVIVHRALAVAVVSGAILSFLGFNVAAGATLGVRLRATDNGVAISDVAAGSPAQRAGIQSGDRLVSIDGRKVGTIDQVLEAMRAHTTAANVKVVVDRGGQERAIAVAASPPRPRHRAVLGAKLAEKEGRIALAGTTAKGPARDAGLQPEDRIVAVDGAPVANMQQVLAQLARHRPDETINLLVERNGWQRSFSFKLGDRSLLSAMPENAPPPPQTDNAGNLVPPQSLPEQEEEESNVNTRALDTDFD